MSLPKFKTKRFVSEKGLRIFVQVPEENKQFIISNVLKETRLKYGDYDRVTFTTTPGTQQFRSLGTGRNKGTENTVEVACVELSFFVEADDQLVSRIIEMIYFAHPYEEPVIFIESCIRTLHIRGLDEDNPNRFWNSKPANWVPEEHR